MSKSNRHYRSTIEKAKMINSITKRYYEEGNQKRSLKGVWRSYIKPIYSMCYRTYLRYLRIAREKDTQVYEPSYKDQKVQQLLFDFMDTRINPYR
ncbi:MAG: hypothetical protein CSB01_01430 [Bacteroidia bacterium]|nr:MAG: hypothetical protein CSB01_01430 [Bacteroidia bacterium]